MGEGLHLKEISQEDTGDTKQGSKKSGCLASNLGLFSIGERACTQQKLFY